MATDRIAESYIVELTGNSRMKEFDMAQGEKKHITLADGSTVLVDWKSAELMIKAYGEAYNKDQFETWVFASTRSFMNMMDWSFRNALGY